MQKNARTKKEDILCRLFTRSSRPPAIRESVETWNSFRQAELVSRAARKTPKEIQRKTRKTDRRYRGRPRSRRERSIGRWIDRVKGRAEKTKRRRLGDGRMGFSQNEKRLYPSRMDTEGKSNPPLPPDIGESFRGTQIRQSFLLSLRVRGRF